MNGDNSKSSESPAVDSTSEPVFYSQLNSTQRARVSEVCTAYEQRVAAGGVAQLEARILKTKAQYRVAVLEQLLPIEIEHLNRTRGSLPTLHELTVLYPNLEELLAVAHKRLSPELRVPDVLGAYQLIRVVGSGSQAMIAIGRHKRLMQQVAIKFSRDEDSSRRLLQEAAFLSRLEGLNVPSIIDDGRTPDGTAYFIMDYLEGQNLFDLVTQNGAFRDKIQAAEAILQIADTVSEMHRRGIIHRDLSPKNIHVGNDEILRIVDFGLAIDASSGLVPLREVKEFHGTPAFMAPEQLKGIGNVNPTLSDVYSLGQILLFLQGGLDPVTSSRNVCDLSVFTDRSLARIYEKATHPDPSSRYSSAGDFSVEIRTLVSSATRRRFYFRCSAWSGIAVGVLVAASFFLNSLGWFPAEQTIPEHAQVHAPGIVPEPVAAADDNPNAAQEEPEGANDELPKEVLTPEPQDSVAATQPLDFSRFREPQILQALHEQDISLLRVDEFETYSYLRRMVATFNTSEALYANNLTALQALHSLQNPSLLARLDRHLTKSTKMQSEIASDQLNSFFGGFMKMANIRKQGGSMMQESQAFLESATSTELAVKEIADNGEHDGLTLALLLLQSPEDIQQIMEGIEKFASGETESAPRPQQPESEWTGPETYRDLPADSLAEIELDLARFALLVAEGGNLVMEPYAQGARTLQEPSRGSLTLYYRRVRDHMKKFDVPEMSKDLRRWAREVEEWARRWEPATGEVPYGPIMADYFTGNDDRPWRLGLFSEYNDLMEFVSDVTSHDGPSTPHDQEVAELKTRAKSYLRTIHRVRPDFAFDLDVTIQSPYEATMKLPQNIRKVGPLEAEEMSPESMVQAELALATFAQCVSLGGEVVLRDSRNGRFLSSSSVLRPYYAALREQLRDFLKPEFSQDLKQWAKRMEDWVSSCESSNDRNLYVPIVSHFFVGRKPTDFCESVFGEYGRLVKVIEAADLENVRTAEQREELNAIRDATKENIKTIQKIRSDFVLTASLGLRKVSIARKPDPPEEPQTDAPSRGRGVPVNRRRRGEQ